MLDAKLLKPQSLRLTETRLTGTLIMGTFEKRVPGYSCFTRFGASHLEVRHGRHRFRRFFIFSLLFDMYTRRKIVNKAKYIFICLACFGFTCIARNLASEELLRQVFI